ncbi:MAG: PAS domain-containing protein [Sneathiella sp.]|nr:PAS domain-containing protein [Sneathiella sp.]
MTDLGKKPDEVNLIGRKTVRKILMSFGAMLLLSIVIIVGLVALSARSQNQIALQQSRNLVNSLLKERLNQLVQLNISSSYWDQAVDHLAVDLDKDWADNNISNYVHTTFGVTTCFVLDDKSNTIYAMESGIRSEIVARDFYASDFDMLVSRVRKTAVFNGSGITFGFTQNNGVFYLTTAAQLRGNASEIDSEVSAATESILVYSTKIDDAFLAKMAQSFGLDNLRIITNESDALTEKIRLTSISNVDIGYLTWTVALPGNKMLQWVLPVAAAVVTLYALVMIFVYRQAGSVAVALHTETSQAKKFEAAYLETEYRFKAFIDNTPSAIVLKDAEGRFLVANNTWNEWANPKGLDIKGRTALDFFGKDIADEFLDEDRRVIQTGENIHQEHQLTKANGDSLSVLVQKFPIRNGDGKIVAMGMLGTDISERKAIEKGLREAKHTAEMANKSKSEFLANMSHELRTPLNAILGFSDILKAEAFGPLGQKNYLEYAHDINAAGRHLLDVINEILDVAKIEAGQMVLAEKNLDMSFVLDSCHRMVNVRAKDAGVKLKFELAPNLPTLFADETRVKQILNNLLSNAIKFTDPKGTVAVLAKLTEKGQMQIIVKDNGIGIKEAEMKTILSQFGQAQSSYARNHEGTGLGLTLVQLLVDAHDGVFEIESIYGQGTTTTVTFPLTRVLEAA